MRPTLDRHESGSITTPVATEPAAPVHSCVKHDYNRRVMYRVAFASNAFKKHSLADAIDVIASIGYGAVEVMADVPHAYPPNLPVGSRQAVKLQLERQRLTVSNINAFTLFACGDTYHPTWIEHDPAKVQIRIAHTIGAVELAAVLGAATVSVQPGGPLIGTGMSSDVACERFAAALSQVLPRARELGVTLAVEPEPGLLIQSSDEYMQFKNRYFRDDSLVKMNCDIGHLFCVGDDPAAVIRAMPDQIAHVHLEDIGANRVHQHLTPGRGVIDFAGVFAALRDVGYNGYATVELYPYETTAAGVARAAWEHLRPLLDRVV
jgi:sugar phosphate isomerase/epimerase